MIQNHETREFQYFISDHRSNILYQLHYITVMNSQIKNHNKFLSLPKKFVMQDYRTFFDHHGLWVLIIAKIKISSLGPEFRLI